MHHLPPPARVHSARPAQPSLSGHLAGPARESGRLAGPAQLQSDQAAWPARPAQPGLAQLSPVWLSGQGSPAWSGLESYMVTCQKSDMVKICPTLDLVKKAGFQTLMDIKSTIVLPFDLKMEADILTFQCGSSHRPQKIRLSRICRDPRPTIGHPKI